MRALLINPWICDFAAYDLWLKPVGLLRVASRLRSWGWEVDLIDCLNRRHPRLSEFANGKLPRSDAFNCGQFFKKEVEKPSPISRVRRSYFRYGLPRELFQAELEQVDKPDLIMVGSTMTYWYPGYFLALKLARESFPGIPAILGGLYPRLCPEHAHKFSGATTIHTGGGTKALARLIQKCGFPAPSPYREKYWSAANDLLPDRSALAIQTSQGCPFSCSYCATSILEPRRIWRKPEEVADEIEYCVQQYGTTDFAFYDNALLYKASAHFDHLLSLVLRRNIPVRFHTPNGLQARFLTPKTAELMKASGFVTLRLSLETSQPKRQKATGGKITNPELAAALDIFERTGFERSEIGVYTLIGLPGQSREEVEEDIHFINGLGATISLATYSPIPGTRDYALLEKKGLIEKNMDPLWHNNTIFGLRQNIFTLESTRELRKWAASLNRKLKSPPA